MGNRGRSTRSPCEPLSASNYWPGTRIRIEVSSSNFPRFDRNLNTGAATQRIAKGVVGQNKVHHWEQTPVAGDLHDGQAQRSTQP